MFSWYGKSRLADTETGPQPFILSYAVAKDSLNKSGDDGGEVKQH